MFYKVEIQWIERSIYDFYTHFFKSIMDLVDWMYRGVILHENKAWFLNFKQVILQNLNISLDKVALLFSLKISLQFIQLCLFSSSKDCLIMTETFCSFLTLWIMFLSHFFWSRWNTYFYCLSKPLSMKHSSDYIILTQSSYVQSL